MKKKITTFAAICSLQFAFLHLEQGLLHAQFNSLWTQSVNPGNGVDVAYAITSDASGVYVAGNHDLSGNAGNNYQWRMEKRNLNTGALITTFGSKGVVNSNPSAYNDWCSAMTADASGIYVAGYDLTNGNNYQWRIEKRSLTTGALITSFGTGGVVTSNPSPGHDFAYAITSDASGIYIAGGDRNVIAGGVSYGNDQWRIEKRDKTTGALIWVQTNDPKNTDFDDAYAIAADASGIYVAGSDNSVGPYGNSQWRMEKRDLNTGAVIWTQTSNPDVVWDDARAITVNAGGVFVAGSQDNNTKWRVEKRDLSTGALIPPFGTNGVLINVQGIGGTYLNAITANAGGIYLAGCDRNYLTTDGGQFRTEKRDLTTGALLCSVTSNPSTSWDCAHAITANASGIYVAGRQGGANERWRMEKYDLCGAAAITAGILPLETQSLDIISIYPNPSTDYIEFLVGSENEGAVMIKVFDMMGREVLSNTETLDGGSVNPKRLSTASLASGSYILQIVTNRQEQVQKQFMVR